ncbi:MAG: cyclase family protein [Desulfuromonadales bacterium]|nr:cyclase family protein [Desulfuromonadales bacterium]
MKTIDLSHPIHPEIPVYPGTEPPQITPANSIERDGFAEILISMYSHTATHIDAPCHLLPHGKSLDQFPAGHFIGTAVVIDLRSRTTPEIALKHITLFAEQLNGVDFVLLNTGWSVHWGKANYFEGYPYLSEEAADWLSSFPLRGVGIDTISIDPLDSPDLPAHRQLLGNDFIIIENLTNLQAVSSRCTFSCLPLPVRGADGSPVRAVAIENCGDSETNRGEHDHDQLF